MKTRVDKAANVAIKTAPLILVSLATFVCHVADTDNNGVCYTCGGYSPARDAGRII